MPNMQLCGAEFWTIEFSLWAGFPKPTKRNIRVQHSSGWSGNSRLTWKGDAIHGVMSGYIVKSIPSQNRERTRQTSVTTRHAATSELSYELKESYNQQMHILRKCNTRTGLSNSF